MPSLPYHRENLAAAIQQRARQQLEELGANQLSLRQIARFLAVSPAAVYRHFPDKASLLTVLRTEIVAELTATLREGVLDSADATAMLQRMVANLLSYATDHPHAIAFILTAPLPVPASLTTVVTLYGTQRDGMVPAPQTDLTVWVFLLGILGQTGNDTLTVTWVTTRIAWLIRPAETAQ